MPIGASFVVIAFLNLIVQNSFTAAECPPQKPSTCTTPEFETIHWSTTFAGSCYYIILGTTERANDGRTIRNRVKMDLEKAHEACRCFSGDLPIIEEEEENKFLSNINGSQFDYKHQPKLSEPPNPVGMILLGMKKIPSQGWHDGTKVTFEPDNWKDKTKNDSCTFLGLAFDFAKIGMSPDYEPGDWVTLKECLGLIAGGVLCEKHFPTTTTIAASEPDADSTTMFVLSSTRPTGAPDSKSAFEKLIYESILIAITLIFGQVAEFL